MNNMFKIIGNNQNFPEFNQFYQLGSEFLPFAQKKLGFNKPVSVNLVSDPENAKDPLGKTAYYDPNNMKITLFVDKRHVKDILRSLSHELVHHTQNCRGDFDKGHDLGEGSFSTNKKLQKLELEAYAKGNGKVVREFEEYMKNKKKSMVAEGYTPANYAEIGDQTTPVKDFDDAFKMARAHRPRLEKFRYVGWKEDQNKWVDDDFNTRLDTEFQLPGWDPETGVTQGEHGLGPEEPEYKLTPFQQEYEKQMEPTRVQQSVYENKEKKTMSEDKIEEEDVVEEKKYPKCPKCKKRHAPGKCPKNEDMTEEDIVEESEELEEKKKKKKGKFDDGDETPEKCDYVDCSESVNENWLKGNKDQLLFETLIKKWCK
jgi:hypothetical protein